MTVLNLVSGGARSPEDVLTMLLEALRESGAELDEATTIRPTRGHPLTLCLHFKDGSTFFVDAEEAER